MCRGNFSFNALDDNSSGGFKSFAAKNQQIIILFGVQERYIVHLSVLEKNENGIRSEQK